jgi:hypothetical protein
MLRNAAHYLLIGQPQSGQRYLAEELARRAHGRVLILDENPNDVHSIRSLETSEHPFIIIRDFSTRLLPLSSDDPWLSMAPALLKEGIANIILTVAHSGASGRETPDTKLFDEVWQLSEGFTYLDQQPRARTNHEVTLKRPNLPALHFRSRAGSYTFDLIQDERLAS